MGRLRCRHATGLSATVSACVSAAMWANDWVFLLAAGSVAEKVEMSATGSAGPSDDKVRCLLP
jgi:hypothetical protein